MGLFGFGNKDKDVLDLAERYRKQKKKEEQMNSDYSDSSSDSSQIQDSSPFSFFDSGSSSSGSSQNDSEVVDLSNSSEERRRKLAKRILEMTSKIEDLSNQIYHLQQRVEVLERKSGTGIERLE